MGGKSKPDNSEVVQQQKQQAAEEAAKEAARQQRLQTGLASIKAAFEGSPVMASQATPYDWSKFNPAAAGRDPNTLATTYSGANLPAGYSVVSVPTGAGGAGGAAATPKFTGGASAAGQPIYNASGQVVGVSRAIAPGPADSGQFYGGQIGGTRGGASSQYSVNTTGAPASGGGGGAASTTFAIRGPDGRIYNRGDPLSITSQVDTGQRTGGFDDAFYNKYKQSVLDYYMPQVQDQYKKAREQATYGLGRSGNLRSSAANTLVADLAKQNAINEAGVRNQADTAAGDLRSQVSTERQKATSQLYATEDPEIAAQQSLSAVRDISLKQPDLSPLSALFNIATIGGANINKGYQAQRNLNTFTGALPKDTQRIVGG
jgi:hypothetical protein